MIHDLVKSYFSPVLVADKASPDVGLHFGMLRGSVLWSKKNYRTYNKPVGEIVKWHNVKYHCHADDTRVYMTLNPCDKWDDIYQLQLKLVLQT